MLSGRLQLADSSAEHVCMFLESVQDARGSKRKASSGNDDVDAMDQPNSSDEGADAHGSDDEARKLRRQLRNRLSAQQARDRKKAQMQQLQDRVMHQQQQIEQLQRQLAETEAANSALRNIICAMKGQPPCKGSKTSNTQQQQQQQLDLTTACSEPLQQPIGVSQPQALLTAVSAPLGPILRSTLSLPPQQQQQQAPVLRHTLSASASAAAAAAAAALGQPEGPARTNNAAAEVAATATLSPTTAAALQFAQAYPYRRKSSSTVASLAGLLPIAKRMANDNPTDTTLQALHQLQQQQWQASADRTVLAAAATAASAAEAAAGGILSPAGGRAADSSSGIALDLLLRSNGGGIANAAAALDAQARRRQLLLLLAQRDSSRKALDQTAKQRAGSGVNLLQQQQQQGDGLSLQQVYSQIRVPEQRMSAQQLINTTAAAAAIDNVSIPLNGLQLNSSQGLVLNQGSGNFAAAASNAAQPSMQPPQQQQQQLMVEAPHVSSGCVGAPAPVGIPQQQQQQQQQREAPAAQRNDIQRGAFAVMRHESFNEQQTKPAGLTDGLNAISACGPAAAAAASNAQSLSGLAGDRAFSLGPGASDDLYRFSSTDVMLTDLLADMA